MIPIGRQVERVVIVLIAGVAVYLGFRLFYLVKEKQGELKVAGRDMSLSLTDVAPGIYFALFGSFILVVSLFSKWDSYTTASTAPDGATQVASRGIASEGAAGVIDYSYTFGRDWDEGRMDQYGDLLSMREVIQSSLDNGTVETFGRSDSVDLIKERLKNIVAEEHFTALMEESSTIPELFRFIESYLPYYYITYSRAQE